MEFEEYFLFESSHDSLMSRMYKMSGIIICHLFLFAFVLIEQNLFLVTHLDVQCPWSTVVTNSWTVVINSDDNLEYAHGFMEETTSL